MCEKKSFMVILFRKLQPTCKACYNSQADKNLEKRVYTLQSGTAIVTHSRSKKERRFMCVSLFFAFSFQFLSAKTAKTPFSQC
jgi:hypothetical protein